MNILIKNANIVDLNDLSIKTQDILIEGNRFKTIKKHIDCADCEQIDASGMLALPALIDCHTHLPQSFLQGPLDDLPIDKWLVELFKFERCMDDETYYYATVLGAIQAIKNGVGTINEMGNMYHIDAQIKALKDCGIRGCFGVDTTDIAENELTPILTIEQALAINQKIYDALKDDELLSPTCAPAGLPAVSKELAMALKDFANKHNEIYHTHLAEGKQTTEAVGLRFKTNGEAFALEECGILDDHTLLAHSIWLSKEEIDLISQRGAIPVYCPSTNLKIADGIPNVAYMLEKGIPVCFGCDGQASSSNRDLLMEARIGSYLQKGSSLNPTCMDTLTTLRMLTLNGAKALDIANLGEIKQGNLADMILVDIDNDLDTIGKPQQISNLIYCGSGKNVTTTIINGQIKMLNRKLIGFDEKQIRKKCQELIVELNEKKDNFHE